MLPRLSIVVPIGPGESAWRALLGDLQRVPVDVELLLVGVDAAPPELDALAGVLAGRLRWLQASQGRASQQNAGAAAARGNWLCFLHADSRLEAAAVRALAAVAQRAAALYHFDLGFFDGPALLRLNALGANLRSRLFGLPFGDQGLCLPRADFQRLGGFDERLPRAEDHALVWAAHRAKLPVRRLGARLRTSGRRYAEAGWLRTTLRFLALSWTQARAFSKGSRP
ncbi:glycosyl transferase family 2 [uncultured Aquimonas sp.]|uniref:glycosyl transferase family 2 n=1 Tax=uncultured Aquimonas sp. TaxID=385483 RepID=UPI00086B4C46|nr:glycosyl transferase family 2 [uncultured Aquimonas sp.]ODU46354.1 MAG: hypothetical protein ABS96_10720 [Xanthomonadaceae bacterium SCN 69-123]